MSSSTNVNGNESHSTASVQQQRVGQDSNSRTESAVSIEEVNGNSDTQLREFFRKMKNERHRLESFQTGNWPHSFIDPKDLAKAGFFYLLNADRVQCAFCRGVVCNWEQGDIPLMEHMRHYPRCEFLLEYNVGNVPIDEDPSRGRTGVNGIRVGRDVCGNHHHHNRPNPRITVHMDQDKKSKVYSMPMSLNLRELGVRPHQGAKTIAYISYESRLNSFAKWPHTATIKPEKLADAGFFYIGIGDYVKCYYCDGGLCHWDPNDDPWIEHSRWFPDCGFILLNKGYAFVESCRQKFGEGISNTTTQDENSLAMKAINEWYQSDIVKQLQDIQSYPVDIIKAALHRRWLETQVPFEHLGELNDAVVKCLTEKGYCKNGFLDFNFRNMFRAHLISDEKKLDTLNLGSNGHSESSGSSSALSSSPENVSPLESFESNPSTSQSSGDREERLRCKVCLDREVGVLFLPCGHVVTCTQCAPGISNCPICRKDIKGIVRTFFS